MNAAQNYRVVMANALEDQREIVDYLDRKYNEAHRRWFKANNSGSEFAAKMYREVMDEIAQQRFRAMRVQGQLEALCH